MASLDGKRIAVLATSGVEEVELTRPVWYLRERGATVTVITPIESEFYTVIRSKNGPASGNSLYADALLAEVSPDDFDAVYIPGGFSPDHLRMAKGAAEFVQAFRDKMIIAMCHGPQLLIAADLVKGRTLTSWPAIAIDLQNAGAHWVDQPVAVDGNLITARMPKDIPALCAKMEEALMHPEQFRKKAA